MFTQWNTRPDGKGDAYKPGEEKEINTDIILYAQWEKLQNNAEDIEKYHVFYRANNNTTAFSVDSQTPKEAGNSILLQNIFSLDGIQKQMEVESNIIREIPSLSHQRIFLYMHSGKRLSRRNSSILLIRKKKKNT